MDSVVPTNITANNSFIQIILQGDIWSGFVLIILLLMSIASWSIIIRKWIKIRSAIKTDIRFADGINQEDGIPDLAIRSQDFPDAYTATLFRKVYEEIKVAIKSNRLTTGPYLENHIERIIERSIIICKSPYEGGLNWLATISASAPFIGLLGTVLGIINSFYSISAKGASSIAVVAPGLSAALVATAAGLFTAIPALIAYNILKNRVSRVREDLVKFGLALFPLMMSFIDSNRQKKQQ